MLKKNQMPEIMVPNRGYCTYTGGMNSYLKSLIATPANGTNVFIRWRTDKGFSLVTPHLQRLHTDSTCV